MIFKKSRGPRFSRAFFVNLTIQTHLILNLSIDKCTKIVYNIMRISAIYTPCIVRISAKYAIDGFEVQNGVFKDM